jgi:membrane-bound serine protease (ClpP class)
VRGGAGGKILCRLQKYLLVLLVPILLLINTGGFLSRAGAGPESLVYVVPVQQTVDAGMVALFTRVYQEAAKQQATAVILEIDTLGGYLDAALKIRDIVDQSPVKTIAYIRSRAISAGVLVALAADQLVMAPGTTIGAAEPRLGNQRADEKTISFWTAQLAGAAAAHGRDPQLASAMADADLEIPGLVAKGKLLTLTAEQAQATGFVDDLLPTQEAVQARFGLAGARTIAWDYTPGEKLMRWVSNPFISGLLLTVGVAGLVIELLTAGFGVAGALGLLSLSLYFGGSILAGFSGWEALVLFLAGLVLVVLEAFVIPGFGVVGIAGIGALAAGVILASPTVEQGILSLLASLVVAIILTVLSLRFLPTRKVWQRLVLSDRQDKEAGYVAPEIGLNRLVGLEGVTLTPLRPAGAIEIKGERIDVVTDGPFIAPGTPVQVYKVEGTRVVVRRLNSD